MEERAIIDKIINEAKHRIILFLNFVNLFEFVCFIMIVSLVLDNIGRSTMKRADPTRNMIVKSHLDPHVGHGRYVQNCVSC